MGTSGGHPTNRRVGRTSELRSHTFGQADVSHVGPRGPFLRRTYWYLTFRRPEFKTETAFSLSH